jgi:hypothetical protein
VAQARLAAWARGCAGTRGRWLAGGRSLRGRAARGRRKKKTFLPEADHILQAGEEAGEHGKNQGVHRRRDAGPGRVVLGHRAHLGSHAGDERGQWG